MKKYKEFLEENRKAALALAATMAAGGSFHGTLKHLNNKEAKAHQTIQHAINDPTVKRYDDRKQGSFVDALNKNYNDNAKIRTFRPSKNAPNAKGRVIDTQDHINKITTPKPFPKTSGKFGLTDRTIENDKVDEIGDMIKKWKPTIKENNEYRNRVYKIYQNFLNRNEPLELPKGTTRKISDRDRDHINSGGHWMDKWHVDTWKHENPEHSHLSGHEAYEKYIEDRKNKTEKFMNKIDDDDSKPKKVKYSGMGIFSPETHDPGLHHFQEIPKNIFVKHWKS